MQIRHTKLEIPPDDPFKNDALGRKDLEPPLTQFVTQASGSFVLALDASWGSGKTTFLEMWKVKLSQAGHACLYLNAWQNDFAQDPLIAIIGELTEAIEEFAKQSGETESALKEQMEKTRQFAQSLLKRLLPLGIKIATHGLLDIKEAAIEKAIADATSFGGEDLIKNYEKGKSEIDKFREAIGDLASQVASSLNPLAKVVIIIDELDRCRPTYAIELLERVKHLFDASGVVFILGIDRSQLNHSIRSLYGSEFDARGYLRRFIDVDYRLPEPKVGNYCDYLFQFFDIENLVRKIRVQNADYEFKQLREYLGGLMSAASMSLRVQEQIVAKLRIVLQTFQACDSIFPVTLSFLLFLREWDSSVYADFIEKKIDISNLLIQIRNLPKLNDSSIKVDLDLIEVYILAIFSNNTFSNDNIHPRLKKYLDLDKSMSDSTKSEDLSNEVKRARRIIKLTDNLLDSRNRIFLTGFEIILKRIDFTSDFVSYD
jgi:KAP family P-loop domain